VPPDYEQDLPSSAGRLCASEASEAPIDITARASLGTLRLDAVVGVSHGGRKTSIMRPRLGQLSSGGCRRANYEIKEFIATASVFSLTAVATMRAEKANSTRSTKTARQCHIFCSLGLNASTDTPI